MTIREKIQSQYDEVAKELKSYGIESDSIWGMTLPKMKTKLENAKRVLEGAKQKAYVEKYWQEHPQEKESLKQELKAYKEKRKAIIEKTKASLEEMLEGACTFKVRVLDCSYNRVYVELNLKDRNEWVQFATVELYYEMCYFGEGVRFDANVGTTGSFSPEDTSVTARSYFYQQLGKLLASEEVLGKMKVLFEEARLKESAVREKADKINARLENPLDE